MTTDHYPAVTITATDIKPVRPNHPEHGAFLKMNDGAVYISITAETARQWISVLEKVAADAPKSPESSGFLVE